MHDMSQLHYAAGKKNLNLNFLHNFKGDVLMSQCILCQPGNSSHLAAFTIEKNHIT